MKTPYTNQEIQRIVKLRMAGWSPAAISGMVGRSKQTIDRLLSLEKRANHHAYPPLPHKRKWDDRKIEEMARKYPARSYAQLGVEYHVAGSRIHALMARRAHGLQNGTWEG